MNTLGYCEKCNEQKLIDEHGWCAKCTEILFGSMPGPNPFGDVVDDRKPWPDNVPSNSFPFKHLPDHLDAWAYFSRKI